MDLARHCELCEHQEVDFDVGTTCGLTNKKPDYFRSCPSIKLEEKFWNKLKKSNVKLQLLKNAGLMTYLHATIISSIGVAVICGGYLIGVKVLEVGVISTVPVIIMGIGLSIIPYGLAPLGPYRNKLTEAGFRKNEIDQILASYGIQYSMDLKFGKEVHGSQAVQMDLSIKGLDRTLQNIEQKISESFYYETA